MSPFPTAFTPPENHHHFPFPFEKIYYLQCNSCETTLQVSFPFPNLHGAATVRCGKCNTLLSVNLLPLITQATPDDHEMRLKDLKEILRRSQPNPNRLINQPSPDLNPPVFMNKHADGKKVAETGLKDPTNVGGEEIRKRMVLVMLVMVMGMLVVNALRGCMF